MSNPRPNIKPRADSVIASMTQAQRADLETWLVDENLSYKDTMARCQRRFGITIHSRAIVTFYRQTAQKRNLEAIIQSAQHAKVVVKTLTKHQVDTWRALEGIIGQFAFQIAVDPEKKSDVGLLRSVIDLLITARKDEREEQKFTLEREKWEFDVVRTCQAHHAELQAIASDDALDEDAKLDGIRRQLFGRNFPDGTRPPTEEASGGNL